MEFIFFLDSKLTQFIYFIIPHNQFFNMFFSFFSLYGNSIFLWIGIVLIVLFLEERKYPGIQKKDILFVTSFILSFGITSILVNYILKPIYQRPRPFVNHVVKVVACPKDYSFPSGHASAAFAAVTVIVAYDKKRKWLYYGVAVLISLSRIYLGCHYFFDVVSGALLGFIVSQFILQVFNTNRQRH